MCRHARQCVSEGRTLWVEDWRYQKPPAAALNHVLAAFARGRSNTITVTFDTERTAAGSRPSPRSPLGGRFCVRRSHDGRPVQPASFGVVPPFCGAMKDSRETNPATNAGGTIAHTRPTGLDAEEVAARVAIGQDNSGGERTSRTMGEILRANIFARFNFLLGTLFIAIVAVGELQDSLFGIVMVANALIGILQELRAKHTLDHLALLSAHGATVVRDGGEVVVPVDKVVLDDLISLRTGDQIVADGIVRSSAGLQVDESLLTGEVEPVDKAGGDQVLSGSFVVAGSGRYQTTAV